LGILDLGLGYGNGTLVCEDKWAEMD